MLALFEACTSATPVPVLIKGDPSIALDPATFVVNPPLLGPPATGSVAAEQDLQKLLAWQHRRTADECARAVSEVTPTLQAFYGHPHGPLSAAEVSRLAPDLEPLLEGVYPLIRQAKDRWTRPRPHLFDSRLQPCVRKEASSSYPSGHGVLIAVLDHTLALIRPDWAPRIHERSLQIAEDRILSGAHYPSDITDGWALGDQVFNRLEARADFRAMVVRLRADVGPHRR